MTESDVAWLLKAVHPNRTEQRPIDCRFYWNRKLRQVMFRGQVFNYRNNGRYYADDDSFIDEELLNGLSRRGSKLLVVV